ncbi:hypothetical protein ABZ354_20030 [Streptomyces sp. NPDC005925]|uniref:hypothetical protein n=1 Tax=Streptomyces sp. NPDC005925 TaxID=3157172 RepID=UPI0034072E36
MKNVLRATLLSVLVAHSVVALASASAAQTSTSAAVVRAETAGGTAQRAVLDNWAWD